MKLKTGFILHQVGEEYIVVAVEERTKEFCGMIKLNRTAAFLWEQMKEEFTKEDLTNALLEKYDVSKEKAKCEVDSFLDMLLQAKVIEE